MHLFSENDPKTLEIEPNIGSYTILIQVNGIKISLMKKKWLKCSKY